MRPSNKQIIIIISVLPSLLLSAYVKEIDIDYETPKMSPYVNYPDQLSHATITGGVAPHCAFAPGTTAVILSVDGKKTDQKFWFQDDKWNLSPGFHTIRVAANRTPYIDAYGVRYIAVKMSFNAKAGEDYKVIVITRNGKGVDSGTIR